MTIPKHCALDELLDNDFRSFTYDKKCELKNQKPTPCLSLEYKDGKFTRKFQSSWYNKYAWLSGCDKRDKLFCFVCAFFRGDSEWSSEGVSTIKNITRKAEKHAISKTHLKNRERFHLLGKVRVEHSVSEGRRLEAQKHNEQVDVNRRVLARMVHAVCYLGKQELDFGGHRENAGQSTSLNGGNYAELLDLLAREEQFFKGHFTSSSSVCKSTSNTFQNDLIQCVTDVIRSKIFKEIKSVNFVSVQVDETTDVSCRSQISLIFRYVVEQNVVERFVGFFDVPEDKTGSGLADVINAQIIKWEIGNKIVGQTYDGASVTADGKNGVQNAIGQMYPNVLFIHCYAHPLSLVLLHGAKTIRSVKMFICGLTMFHTFFSRSTKRNELLREQGFKLPSRQCGTRWNYRSRAASTVKIHFQELKNAVKHVIEESNWDPISTYTASGLLDTFNDAKFVYLLIFFEQIFIYTDHVFNFLQSKNMSDIRGCVNEVEKLKSNLSGLRNEEFVVNCCEEANRLNNILTYDCKLKENLHKITYEILDLLILQIDIRFKDFSSFEFVELTNEKKFKTYSKHFPEIKLSKLLKQYPNYFDEHRLRNELQVIYSDTEKHIPPLEVLDFFFKSK